jgi:hypothetical protein
MYLYNSTGVFSIFPSNQRKKLPKSRGVRSSQQEVGGPQMMKVEKQKQSGDNSGEVFGFQKASTSAKPDHFKSLQKKGENGGPQIIGGKVPSVKSPTYFIKKPNLKTMW